jgi:hypothetical protein
MNPCAMWKADNRIDCIMRHKTLEIGVLNGEDKLISGEMVKKRYRAPAVE